MSKEEEILVMELYTQFGTLQNDHLRGIMAVWNEAKKQERQGIISWLRDLGADEYMLSKLNNAMVIQALKVKG